MRLIPFEEWGLGLGSRLTCLWSHYARGEARIMVRVRVMARIRVRARVLDSASAAASAARLFASASSAAFFAAFSLYQSIRGLGFRPAFGLGFPPTPFD